jgi:hypothetical protein
LVEVESKKRQDANGLPVKSVMAVPLDKAPRGEEEEALEHRIMRALNTTRYMSLSQLATDLDLPNPKTAGKNKVHRALQKLERRGHATKDPGGNWRLIKEAKRLLGS